MAVSPFKPVLGNGPNSSVHVDLSSPSPRETTNETLVNEHGNLFSLFDAIKCKLVCALYEIKMVSWAPSFN